ncbi:hypothetical protein EDD15DRAFT_2368712 [Pisolithus albus]|nr:hypothetical protein EDD15DRAFT_2368712 [Pisolithus albus]
MGSTGSGRSNSIDKSAGPEGAKARRPAIQAPHTMADWLGRNSAELQEAIRSMCSWYLSSLMMAYRHPWAWTTYDQDRVGLHGCGVGGSMGPRIDKEPVTYPGFGPSCPMTESALSAKYAMGPIVIGRPGGRSVTCIGDPFAGMYAPFQTQVTCAVVIGQLDSIDRVCRRERTSPR